MEDNKMTIEVVELCVVSYINENDPETQKDEKRLAKRTVVYDSPKESLLEAFQDYNSENFNIDNVVEANDEFEGECLDLVKYLSVKEVES